MNVAKVAWRWVVKNAPAIMTYSAVATHIGTVALAADAGKKGEKALFKAKVDKADKTGVVDQVVTEGKYTDEQIDDPLVNREILNIAASKVELTFKEKFNALWPVWWKTGVASAMSITCIILPHRMHVRRAATLSSTLSAAQMALQQNDIKLKKFLGERGEKEFKEEVAKEYVKENPPTKENTSIGYGHRRVWFCDPLTGQYMLSDMETVKSRVNGLNRDLNEDHWVAQNDFLYRLGFREVKGGEAKGWTLEDDCRYDNSSGEGPRYAKKHQLINLSFIWQDAPDDLPRYPDVDPTLPVAMIDYNGNYPFWVRM